MSKKCLLLKFPDEREVFTHEKYQHIFIEFSKSFNVKMFNVEADDPILLHPKDVVKCFCDQNVETNTKCNYKLFHNKIKKTRSYDLKEYIETNLLEGNIVSIKELYNKFQKHNLSVSTIYRHLNFVKNKLQKEGKKIEKISVGCYRISC